MGCKTNQNVLLVQVPALPPQTPPATHPKLPQGSSWPARRVHQDDTTGKQEKDVIWGAFFELITNFSSTLKRPQQPVYQNLIPGLKLQEKVVLSPDFPNETSISESAGGVSFEITSALFILSRQEEFPQPPVRALFFNNINQASLGGANCFLSKWTVSPHATSAFGGGRNTIHYQAARYMCTKGIYS